MRPRETPAEVEGLREIISLWLRWSDAQETLTVRMFNAEEDPSSIEDLADQADQLRDRVIHLSRAVLHESGSIESTAKSA